MSFCVITWEDMIVTEWLQLGLERTQAQPHFSYHSVSFSYDSRWLCCTQFHRCLVKASKLMRMNTWSYIDVFVSERLIKDTYRVLISLSPSYTEGRSNSLIKLLLSAGHDEWRTENSLFLLRLLQQKMMPMMMRTKSAARLKATTIAINTVWSLSAALSVTQK